MRLAAAPIALIVLAALVTTDRVDDVTEWVAEAVPIGDDPEPSVEGRIADDYFGSTRRANFWADEPLMPPESEAFYRRHFDVLDPRDRQELMRRGAVVGVDQFVSQFPLFTGRWIRVVGTIRALQVLAPRSRNRVEWVAQLGPVDVGRPERSHLVYCRYTESPFRPVPVGGLALLSGVAIAGGEVQDNKGGITNAIYVACSGIGPAPARFRPETVQPR